MVDLTPDEMERLACARIGLLGHRVSQVATSSTMRSDDVLIHAPARVATSTDWKPVQNGQVSVFLL
jgi:hypothetical protein